MNWKEPDVTTSGWFATKDKKGRLIENYGFEICYRQLTQYAIQKDVRVIRTWIEKRFCPYKPHQIVKYIKHINDFGLPCQFTGTKEGCYYFTIKVGEGEITSKRILTATLMAIKCLWEHHINEIPFYFSEICVQCPEIDRWEAFQLAYTYLTYGNSNHTIFRFNPMKFISLKDFHAHLNGGLNIYTNGCPQISYLSDIRKSLNIIPLSEYKLRYNQIINA